MIYQSLQIWKIVSRTFLKKNCAGRICSGWADPLDFRPVPNTVRGLAI
jgi:hypothetical protein